MVFHTLHAMNKCNPNALGPTMTSAIRGYDLTDISTYIPYTALDQTGPMSVRQLTITDIVNGCPEVWNTHSAYTQTHPMYNDTGYRCGPRFVIPTNVVEFGYPWWRSCELTSTAPGIIDPPHPIDYTPIIPLPSPLDPGLVPTITPPAAPPSVVPSNTAPTELHTGPTTLQTAAPIPGVPSPSKPTSVNVPALPPNPDTVPSVPNGTPPQASNPPPADKPLSVPNPSQNSPPANDPAPVNNPQPVQNTQPAQNSQPANDPQPANNPQPVPNPQPGQNSEPVNQPPPAGNGQPAQISQPANGPQPVTPPQPTNGSPPSQGTAIANNPAPAQIQPVSTVSVAIIGTNVISAISGGSKAPAIILPEGSTLQPNIAATIAANDGSGKSIVVSVNSAVVPGGGNGNLIISTIGSPAPSTVALGISLPSPGIVVSPGDSKTVVYMGQTLALGGAVATATSLSAVLSYGSSGVVVQYAAGSVSTVPVVTAVSSAWTGVAASISATSETVGSGGDAANIASMINQIINGSPSVGAGPSPTLTQGIPASSIIGNNGGKGPGNGTSNAGGTGAGNSSSYVETSSGQRTRINVWLYSAVLCLGAGMFA